MKSVGVDAPTQAVLDDLARLLDVTKTRDLKALRAAYAHVFGSWTALACKPTREDWIKTHHQGRVMHSLRVEPLDYEAGAGCLLFLHGGGWMLGSALCYAPLCRYLAAVCGMRVYAPDFPLAPEEPYPAALSCLRSYALSMFEELAPPFAIAGDSAGATLGAILSADTRLHRHFAAQLLFYPVIDLRPASRYESRRCYGNGAYFLRTERIAAAAAAYCATAGDPASGDISPLCSATPQRTPPTYLLIPECDPLRDECYAYTELLRTHDVEVAIFKAARTIHGCVSFSGRIAQGRVGLDAAGRFLRNILHQSR